MTEPHRIHHDWSSASQLALLRRAVVTRSVLAGHSSEAYAYRATQHLALTQRLYRYLHGNYLRLRQHQYRDVLAILLVPFEIGHGHRSSIYALDYPAFLRLFGFGRRLIV